MNEEEKNNIIEDILGCMGKAVNMESDDSEKEDILIGLTNLCKNATYLPTNKPKKKWIKSCRKVRRDRGGFLTTELLLTNDACYNNYLAMSKTQFEYLLNLVKQDITRANTQMRDAITPAEKLALTLRFLVTGESFHSIEHHTKVSRSAICAIVPEVCRSIRERLHGLYLKFPSNSSEWKAIAKNFEIIWKFPNCLGALGEKHINFRPQRKENSNGRNTIIMMALVDAKCKFTYVDISCKSYNYDSDVFLQSSLREVLENGKEIPQKSFEENGRCLPYVVIGDDAFQMQTYLIKPYPNDIDSKEKQVFNARLLHAKYVVKHSFGILANRFRVLMSPLNLKVDTVKSIVYACCVLHNFIIQSDKTYINSITNPTDNSNNNFCITHNPCNDNEESVRQQFAEYFNNEGLDLNYLDPKEAILTTVSI